jgi:hypothetical protein
MRYVFLSSLFLFVRCESDNGIEEQWESIDFSYTEIKLDEALPIESNFIQSYDYEGKSNLFLLDLHDHELIIVDKNSGKVKRIDFRKRCFHNSKLSGFFFKNDTILLFHRLIIKEVHYYNIRNESKGSLKLKNTEHFLENILIDSSTPVYFFDNEWRFLAVPKEFPFKSKYLMIDKRYNEKTEQEYGNIVEVPSSEDTIFLHESLPYRISVGDTIDYYSWGFNDSIVAINKNQEVRKFYFGCNATCIIVSSSSNIEIE